MPDLFRIGTDDNFYRVEDRGIDPSTGVRMFGVEAHSEGMGYAGARFTLPELKQIHANLTDIISRYSVDGHLKH